MENFFNTNSKQPSTPIMEQYDSLKDNYEEIFIEAAESIRKEIDKFKPENPCTICTVKDCKVQKKDIFTDYPVGCTYQNWQKQALSFLDGEYRQKLKRILQTILDKQKEYTCIQCGNCCRLATSEFSYEQLKQRAFKGDPFSKEFVSIFVPYENQEDAKKANPEFYELLESLMEDQKVFYYYCPKVIENKCSDYENRPNICKDFPNNPLKLLPSTCSYNAWKNSVSKQSLLLRAKLDIIEFYKTKLG